jgi:DNA-binding response OmpR family regulator
MNTVFLNMTSKSIGGVIKALGEEGQIETINARGGAHPITDVCNAIAGLEADILVITETRNSDSDGLQASSAIRSLRASGVRLPIIFLSDFQPEELEQVLNAGRKVFPLPLKTVSPNVFDVCENLHGFAYDLVSLADGKIEAKWEFHGLIITGTKPATVSFLGKEMDLSLQSRIVLEAFIRNKGVPLSRERLGQRLYPWGESWSVRDVDSAIKRLRRAIRKHLTEVIQHPNSDADIILTVYGHGYGLKTDVLGELARENIDKWNDSFSTDGGILFVNRETHVTYFCGCRLPPEQSKLVEILSREPGKPVTTQVLERELGLNVLDVERLVERTRNSFRYILKNLGYPPEIPIIDTMRGRTINFHGLQQVESLRKLAEEEFQKCGFSIGSDNLIYFLEDEKVSLAPSRNHIMNVLLRAKGNPVSLAILCDALPGASENNVRQLIHYLNHDLEKFLKERGYEIKGPLVKPTLKSYRIIGANILLDTVNKGGLTARPKR